MELEDIKQRIVEKTGLSKEEVEQRIEEKILELSNLVSEEGAAYIVAKEEGLDLLEKRDRSLKIKNIIPGMKTVEVLGKILEISEQREFEREKTKGKVQHIIVGDDTGKIRVVFWNDKVALVENLDEGDVVRIKNGYTRANTFGIPEIHMGRGSVIQKEDLELEIGEEVEEKPIEMYKTPVERRNLKDLKENDFAEIRGAIVSTFEREFATCSECDSRLKEINGTLICNDHGKVEPKRNLVVKGYIDDGSSTFRFVSFREVAEKINRENLIGKERLFVGRVKRNEYFGDLEMVIGDIKELNVEEEIEKLM